MQLGLQLGRPLLGNTIVAIQQRDQLGLLLGSSLFGAKIVPVQKRDRGDGAGGRHEDRQHAQKEITVAVADFAQD